MKLDDLKQDWQKSLAASDAPDNLTEIIAMLEKETTKVDKEVKRRDFLEISIAILLLPIWFYGLANSVSTMQSLGCVIAIISGLYIPYRLLKARKTNSTTGSSIKDYLNTEKLKLQQQKQLLESVVWWYIAPITLSVVLITLGGTVDETGVPHVSGQLTLYYAMLLLLIVGIYFLNKRAAKKKFGALLHNVEQRLAELDG